MRSMVENTTSMERDPLDQLCAELADPERDRQARFKERQRKNSAKYRKNKKAREEKRAKDLELCQHEIKQLKAEVEKLRAELSQMKKGKSEVLDKQTEDEPVLTSFKRFELGDLGSNPQSP